VRLNYAIVFVSDMQRSVGFYRDVVGLPLRFESPEWSEFATGGATLALHRGERGENGSAEAGRTLAGCCRPGLGVADLDAFHARMQAHDVACTQPPKDVFGSRIAQYVDPDGLVFSVAEER